MALLFMDSFDHYATADLLEKWTSGSTTISAGDGRRSSAALNLGATTSCSNTLTPSGATVIVGFAFVHVASPFIQRCFMGLTNGGTAQIALHHNTDGTIGVDRGGSVGNAPGTILGTTSVVLSTGTYYYLELKVVLDDTAGTVELRINGAPAIGPLTSLDTNNGASNAWNQLQFGSAGHTMRVDDLYVLDGTGSAPLNTFLGDCRVDPCYPTAEGASSAWTPLSGTDNALMVDDTAPDDDTTYVTAGSSGLKDTYVVSDAPVVGGTIYGVQLLWNAKKLDAGTCSLAPVVRHNSTDYPGTPQNPTTSYTYQSQIYATNPGTSAAWTESGFNAAEFGMTRTA